MNDFIGNTRLYGTCWLLFFFGIGILLYVIDRQFLQGICKSVYDMTHKNPREQPRGLIYGQGTARKFLIATIISTLQTFGLFFFTGFHSNPFVELVLWFLEIPSMVFGFATGSFIWPWWNRRKELYQAMDRVDQALEERRAAFKAGSGVGVTGTTIPRPPSPPSAAAPVVNPTAPVTPPPVKKTEISAEERIRRYTGK